MSMYENMAWTQIASGLENVTAWLRINWFYFYCNKSKVSLKKMKTDKHLYTTAAANTFKFSLSLNVNALLLFVKDTIWCVIWDG